MVRRVREHFLEKDMSKQRMNRNWLEKEMEEGGAGRVFQTAEKVGTKSEIRKVRVKSDERHSFCLGLQI